MAETKLPFAGTVIVPSAVVSKPVPFPQIAESEEWKANANNPEWRLTKLIGYANHVQQYLEFIGDTKDHAREVAQTFFHDWRGHAIDNGVRPGEHLSATAMNTITSTVSDLAISTGFLLKGGVERPIDREDRINQRALSKEEQDQIAAQYLGMPPTQREDFRALMQGERGIVIYEDGDNVEVGYGVYYDAEVAFNRPQTVGTIVGSILGNIGENMAGALEDPATHLLKENPRLAEMFLYGDVPRAVTSGAVYLAGGALGGPAVPAVMGTAQGIAQGKQAAEKAGMSIQDIENQALVQGAIGALEGVGLGGKKLDLLTKTKAGREAVRLANKTIFRVPGATQVGRVAGAGFKEGFQESAAGILVDFAEKTGGVWAAEEEQAKAKGLEPISKKIFDAEKRSREFGAAFISGGLLGSLGSRQKEALVTGQMAVTEMTKTVAQSVLDGTHPVMRELDGLVAEGLTYEAQQVVDQKRAAYLANARQVLDIAIQSQTELREAATSAGMIGTPATSEIQSLLSEQQISALRQADEKQFAQNWKAIEHKDKSKIRKALGVDPKASRQQVQKALIAQTEGIVASVDESTATVQEMMSYWNKRAEDAGDKPTKLEVVQTSEELMAAVPAPSQAATEAAQSVAFTPDEAPKLSGEEVADSFEVLGANQVEIRDGVVESSISIVAGEKAPMVLLREKNQVWLKRALQEGSVSLQELDAERNRIEDPEDPSPAPRTPEGMVEWFSDLGVDYFALKAQQSPTLPQRVKNWFSALSKWFDSVMRRVVRLDKAMQEGRVSPRMESLLGQATGLQQSAQFNPTEGLSNQEALAFSKIQGKTEAEVDAYLAENPETSDAVLVAYQEDIRRTKQRQSEATKIATPGLEVGTTLTVGRKMPSPTRMTQRSLRETLVALDNIAREAEAITNEGTLKETITLANRLSLWKSTNLLESVISALPKELKSSVKGFRTMVQSVTPRQRAKIVAKQAYKAQEIVERYTRKRLLNKIDDLLDRGAAKVDNAGKPVGPGADVVELIQTISEAMHLDAIDVANRVDKLTQELNDATDPEKISTLADQLFLTMQFGDIANRDAETLFDAVAALEDIIKTGQTKQRIRREIERQQTAELRERSIKVVTGGKMLNSNEAKQEANKVGSWLESLGDFVKQQLTWDWMLNLASRKDKTSGSLKSDLNRTFGRMVRDAQRNSERYVRDKNKRLLVKIAEVSGIDPTKPHLTFRVGLKALDFYQEKATGIKKKEPRPEHRYQADVLIETARKLRDGEIVRGEDGRLLGLNQGQVDVILQTLENHEAEIAALNEQADDIETEILRLPSTTDQKIRDAFIARHKKALAKLKKLENQTLFKNLELTDWDSVPEVEQILSQDQAIKITMAAKQQDEQANLAYWGYTPEFVAQVEDYLTPESKELRAFLFEEYAAQYNDVNKVYSDLEGVNLPKIRNYSPAPKITGKTIVSTEPGEKVATGMASPRFVINRVKNLKEPDFRRGAISEFQSHVAEMSHYIHWIKAVRTMKGVFGHEQMQKALIQSGGNGLNTVIQNQIQTFENNGSLNSKTLAWIDSIRRALVLQGLSFNLGQIPKQLTGIPAYMFEVPVRSFVRYQSEFAIDVAKAKATGEFSPALKAMLESEFVQTRFEEGFDRDTQQIIKGSFERMSGGKLKPKSLLEYVLEQGMFPSRVGDMGTVIVGGYAAYRHGYDSYLADAKRRGEDVTSSAVKEAAKREAELTLEEITRRTQTGSGLADQTSFEAGGSLAKLFTVFMSNSRNISLSTYMTIPDALSGRPNADVMRRLVVGHVILPSLFQVVVDLLKYPFLDDEEREDLKEDAIKRYGVAMALGPLAGITFVGQGVEVALKKVFGIKGFESNNPMSEAIDKMVEGVAGAPGTIIDAVKEDKLAEAIAKTTFEILKAWGGLKGGKSLIAPIAERGVRSFNLDEDIDQVLFETPGEKAARTTQERYDAAERQLLKVPESERQTMRDKMVAENQITESQSKALKRVRTKTEREAAKETAEIRKLRNQEVGSGARAAMMRSMLARMNPQQREAKMAEWAAARLLSDQVREQLATP